MNRIISNSEVNTFLKCERRHYYAHGLKLAPKHFGRSLSRGIIGHECLERYYNMLIKNASPDDARDAAFSGLVAYIHAGEDPEMIAGLSRLLLEYFDYYESREDWNIIAVEKKMGIPLGDNFDFGMRFDLLVEMRTGPWAGEIVLVDHKFVYNFWDADALMLNMQVPKYVGTLNANGIHVKRCIINQLRWREVKSNPERFRREVITPVAKEIKQIMREQFIASKRIMEREQMGIEEYGATALRTLDNFTCKNCSFALLCKTELIGQDPSLLIETEFMPNTYGYNEDLEDATV